MTFIGFNLVEELTFYGAYHNNPVNQLIHFIFVPLILWTVAVWLAYTPTLVDFDMVGALSFLPPGMASVLSKYVFIDRNRVVALLPITHILMDV